jgi:hypothetical protein
MSEIVPEQGRFASFQVQLTTLVSCSLPVASEGIASWVPVQHHVSPSSGHVGQ